MTNEADPHSQLLTTTTQPCQIHNQHVPNSHVNHRHHVWPLGHGGPNIEDNIIAVCPTGHYSIHDLLSHYLMLMGNVPYSILRGYTLEERKYAKLGYDRIMRKSM
jgi:hypothetical protein